MNDKQIRPSQIPNENEALETQWVMVFNVLMKAGREETKKTYKVNKKRLVIGSALSSDIRIQQNSVSNVHAVVEMDDNGVAHIYDMASDTGVFVNEKKTLSAELKNGDELKIGFATIVFKQMPVGEAQASLPTSAVRSSGARKLFYDAKEDFRPLILEDERNIIQIFDYPNSSEQALQIVMYWGDVILDVKHIVDHKDITLGETKKATFAVPGMSSDFSLVSFDGGVSLNFMPGMTGVVRSDKQMISLDKLGGTKFNLKQNDLAKIQFKDISFFVSYSPLPPHLRGQRIMERDFYFTKIWFTSLICTAAVVFLLLITEKDKTLEVEELPPRVATIIFKPVPPPPPPPVPKEKPPEPPKEVKPPEPVKPPPPPKKPPPPKVEPPKPKELPKVVKPVPKTTPQEKPVTAANQTKGAPAKAAGGNQGEGAKAKGPEGTKGEPNKPKAAVHQVQSKGNPNVKTATKTEVQGKGNVETLLGDLSGSISKSMAAAGAGASSAGKNLRGFGATTTEGNGGLGQLGSGSGGGGESQTLSAGMGTKGLGDGKSGKGLGAIGSGGNLAGTGHGGPNIEVGNASETIIRGGLDRDVIDEYIKRHKAQIAYCYSKELDANKALKGRVEVRFTIAGSGRVSVAGVGSSSIANASVERCVTDVIKKIVFPEPVGGGVVEVSYPFSFMPSVGG